MGRPSNLELICLHKELRIEDVYTVCSPLRQSYVIESSRLAWSNEYVAAAYSNANPRDRCGVLSCVLF